MLGQSFGTIANMRGKTAQPPPGDPVAGISQMVGDLLEKQKGRHEMDAQKAMAQLVAAISTRQRFQPPKPVQPMGGKDLLPMLGIGLLAKLLGAKDQDIAQGAQGFMQGRGEWAQGQNKYNEDVYRADVGNAEADRQSLMDVAKLQYNEATGERDRLQEFQTNSRNRAETRADRRWEQEQLNKRAEMRSPEKLEYYKMLGRTPAGRVQLAMAVRGNDLDAIEASKQWTEQEKLIAEKAATEAAMRPGKVEGQTLKNDEQRIENEWLPKLLETKLWKNQKDAEFVATKIKYYPQFLQATMWRAAIAQQMANNSIGNTEFDNRMDDWKTQGGARIKTYQQEIAGHLKRIAAIDKELGAVNKDTGVGVDPITSTAKTVEKQRIMVRIQQLQQKIEDEVQQVPAVVPGADTPMPEGGALTDTNSPPTNPLSGSVDSGASNTRTRTRTRTNKATPPNKGGVVYQGNVSGANVTMRKKS